MLSHKTSITCLILAQIVLSASCSKVSPDSKESNPCLTNANSPYYISFTGKPFAGDTLVFSVNAPSNVKKTWQFRGYYASHGEYLMDSNPEYVYGKRGLYHVSVIINDDTFNSKCQNPELQIEIGEPYVLSELKNIPGERYWRAYADSLRFQSSKVDTIAIYNDTFGLFMVNEMTLSIKNKLLTAKGKIIPLDGNEFYVFSDTAVVHTLEWETVFYYHKKDSVVYMSHPYQGGYIKEGKYPSHRAYGITTVYHSSK